MTIGDNVKAMMRSRGITQNELAKMAGLSSSGLSTALNPEGNPRIGTIEALAAALGCRASELLDDRHVMLSEALAPQEKQLLAIFRRLDAISQGRVIGYAEALANATEAREETA